MNTGHTRWRTMVLGMLASLGVALTAGAADEKPAENLAQDPYMKLAVARTRVEIALRDQAPAFVPGENGWVAAWAATERARNQVSRTLWQAQATERQRGENQNEPFVADCERRNGAYEQEWGQFCGGTRPALESRLEQTSRRFHASREVFQHVSGMEQPWKAAGLDLAVLESIYVALEKRLLELRTEMDALVKEVQGHQAKWEGELKLIEEVVKQGRGE